MKRNTLALSLVVSALIFLPNCQWFKTEEPTKPAPIKSEPVAQTTSDNAPASPVLLTVKGKPSITVAQFEDYLGEVMKAQPQLKQLMMFMPDAEYELFKSMQNEVILHNWIQENKIDQRADFQKDLKMGQDFLERQLAIKYFQEEYPKKAKLDVADSEARKVYDERKDATPELIISRGGVTARAVMFDSESAAQEFLSKVNQPGADFEQIAKDQNLTVQSFKQVHQQSFEVDGPIREKLMSYKTFPVTELIKSKDKFWVVQATAKEEVMYVPFEEVKDAIKQQLKMQKLFTDELEKVKKTMDIVENKDYFERKKKDREEQLSKMQKEQEAAQPNAKEVKPSKQPVKPTANKNGSPAGNAATKKPVQPASKAA